MKLKKTFYAAFLIGSLTGSEASAANTICRAASPGLYAQSIKRAIGTQMTTAGIPYSSVLVALTANDRKASVVPFSFDATSQVTVTASPLSAVFNGELPAPATCAIPASLRIKVLNGNVVILDKTQPVTVQGVQASTPRR